MHWALNCSELKDEGVFNSKDDEKNQQKTFFTAEKRAKAKINLGWQSACSDSVSRHDHSPALFPPHDTFPSNGLW